MPPDHDDQRPDETKPQTEPTRANILGNRGNAEDKKKHSNGDDSPSLS